MKKYTAVVSHSSGKITKYLDFDSEDDAKAHVATYGGKVVADLDEDVLYWDVSGDTATKDTDQVAADILAIKWEDIRSRRDNLMAESDWRSMPDSPTMSSAWKTYRQALRDLPASESDPDDITWPTEPS
jgi:hypothetical protein